MSQFRIYFFNLWSIAEAVASQKYAGRAA